MLMFHIAFALGLISIAGGVSVYMSAGCSTGRSGSCCGKFLGFLIIVAALLSTFCTAYCGFKSWQANAYPCPVSMMTHEKATYDAMIINKDVSEVVAPAAKGIKPAVTEETAVEKKKKAHASE